MSLPMKSNRRFVKLLRSFVLVGVMFAGILGARIRSGAQELKDIQTQRSPLVLKAQGSFFVGGETVEQTQTELGSFGPAGHISINQMYVRYMIPQGGDRNVSVVMIHGMTHTGKAWETTPDGRMGWDEYFVRKGHPVYVPDQVARGRSGFNQAVFNNVRAGVAPPSALPPMWRFSDEVSWPDFRFGTKPGAPFGDEQFPVAALAKLSKQGIPDLSSALPTPNPNYKALSDLAIRVKNAVLVSHSQSGSFPLEAALINSTGIKGMVLVEPGVCPATYNDQQITTLASLPILVVFGDPLDTPTGIPGFSWRNAFDGCKAFIKRVNAAGGKAQMLHLPDQGIRGNSHMIMQDKNNLQIADLILEWIDEGSRRKVRLNSRPGRAPRR
jgi:pimeloyl-ACP methyl ester carboxylesterase